MKKRTVNKVLIANRGEIASRIARACDRAGIACVMAVSEADTDALFVRGNEVALLGPAAASESYLNIQRIVEVAKESGCDSVHPGYGFLSENSQFAEAVDSAGLTFIGPPAEVIAILGNKTAARKRVQSFGVPCVPGFHESQENSALQQAASEMGYPLLVKAAAGGGGRGMRVVQKQEEFADALRSAQEEARKAFACDEVYLEKLIERPRHVEVQVFGDVHGNIVHFGTRDCSVQRRHQKLVEEAPAPGLSSSLRRKIIEAAINAARSVQYQNAGTVEFLVSGSAFYFLEMNTRIQVEHPVTEMITGLDLVSLQLEVAAGKKLAVKQDEISFDGHALEFRVYAEDPLYNFRPVPGRITSLAPGLSEPWFREDTGFASGDTISSYYDALISKIIVHGTDRAHAIERAREVLRSYKIAGIPTTISFHRWLLELTPFGSAPLDIDYVDRAFSAQSIRALRASEIKDPLYRAPIEGALQRDVFQYQSKGFKTEYDVEVIHQEDGYFLARPFFPSGSQKARSNRCRLSNGRNAALRALIAEVLESVPPSEIWQES